MPFFALALSIFVGCTDSTNSASKTTPSANGNSQGKIESRSATYDEALAFAETFNQAVHSGEVGRVNSLIDWHAIIVESTKDIDASKEARDAFIERSFELIAEGRVEESLINVAGAGRFCVLRVRPIGEEMTVLFRIIPPEGGVNYCEMPIVTSHTGESRAADIFFYTIGERMSQTTRHSFEMGALAEKDLPKSHETREYIEHHDEFLKMIRAVKDRDGERALQLYAVMPPVLQNDRQTLILRIQAALLVDDDRYIAAIEDFAGRYPDDPAVDLYAIDGHILRQRYSLALRSLELLDEKVGGDPYLDVMRSNVCGLADDFREARRYAQRAIDAEPELEDAYWSLLDSLTRLREYSDAVETLSVLEQRFGIEIDDIMFADVPEFVESTEYQRWRVDQSHEATVETTPPED